MFLKALLFSTFLSTAAQAAAVSYKPVTFLVTENLRLKITGLRGRIVLRGSASASQESRITVKKISDPILQNSPWQMTVSQDENFIHLKMKGPADREAWFGSLNIPEFEVTVSGRSLPAEIYWQKGQVIESAWRSPVKVVMVDGEYFGSDGEGKKELNFKKGKVHVKNLQGDFSARFYDSEVKLENCSGSVQIENFSGKSAVISQNGNLHLTSYNGRFDLQKVAGDVDFSIDQGSLDASGYQGKMSGQAKESSVTVRYDGSSSINLSSTSGTVKIVTPKDSAARLNVGSVDGNLYVPGQLKVLRYPNLKVAVGHLEGRHVSWVHVRTGSGDISVR